MLAIAMLVELVVSVLKIFTEYQWSMIAGLNLYELRMSRLFKSLHRLTELNMVPVLGERRFVGSRAYF